MGKSASGSCNKMHKVNPKYHASVKEKILLLHDYIYEKIDAWIKSVYLPDTVAAASSMLTDILPGTGKYITNNLIASAANILTVKLMQKKDLHIAAKARNSKKILIISDLNMGDSVNLQSVALAVKKVFPESKVDYAVNKSMYNLIVFNPYVDRVFNILSTSNIYMSSKSVSSLIDSEKYDIVVNLCPFFKKNHIIGNKQLPFIDYGSLSIRLVHNELYSNGLNHVSYQAYHYFSNLFCKAKKINDSAARKSVFATSIWIPDESIRMAGQFLFKNGLLRSEGLVLFNSDATSKYTRLPFDIQLNILKSLCKSDSVQAILLTSGHTYIGIENKLLNALPSHNKVTVIPKEMPIDVYAALIDFCDVFVTADTGTMHIASAKKFNESGDELRNKTAVFSVFGASSARMYGYDSYNGNFLKPGQNKPSRLYISKAPCRNITCINKKAKKCRNVRCFEGISGFEIAKDIIIYLSKDR